jgi:hypothetical protein
MEVCAVMGPKVEGFDDFRVAFLQVKLYNNSLFT